MASSLTLVTGNPKKVQAVLRHMRPFGVRVVHRKLPLVEPQADSVEEVALSKARQAFRMCQDPILVEDSGFCINEFAGFPGPYTKYVLQTIGVGGLLNLARDLSDRSCHFCSVLVYIDAEGRSHKFIDARGVGKLAVEADRSPCPEAWSDLWRIAIPEGVSVPLSALSPAERRTILIEWAKESVYSRFGSWYRARQELR
jgi:non-canonical purine NTP pyrophosphatase (RdgB/HAM1 family)